MAYLNDKSVMITGASSGIGEQLARELCSRGCSVGLLARREDLLKTLTEELREKGHTAAFRAADVTDRDGLHAALDSLAEELGGADMVVANAGLGRPVPAHKDKEKQVNIQYAVNLNGALNTFYWALPRFIEQESGHLVGVASLAAYLGLPTSSAYSGSKAALRVHLQSLRIELAPRKIHVTTLCPGFIKTPLTDPNPFPMPFLMEVDKACRIMANAIEKRKGEFAFPWQMASLIKAGRMMPTGLMEGLLKGKR